MASATIQKIIMIEPIEGADKIELASVLGWKCVVSKADNVKVGDLVIFIEIDSVVPEKPEFEFLRSRSFRVRTMRLRGVISQGLLIPLYPRFYLYVDEWKEGDDVSDILGVTHYEKPIPANMQGQIAGNFPTHIVPKTDEIRVQSCPEVLDEIENMPAYVTVKCDGTSATYILHNDVFYICSRNNVMKDNEENKDNAYVKMAHKYDIEKKLRVQVNNIAIQGEICGPGIQGNPMGLKELQIFVFSIYDTYERRYVDFKTLKLLCEDLDIPMVPIYLENILLQGFSVSRCIELAKGKYPGTNNHREGIVFRPIVEAYSRALKGRMSFKTVNIDYKED